MTTAIVVLNWKNSLDTIGCIKSIADSARNEMCYLVICDNNSCDGSDDEIYSALIRVCASTRDFNYQSNIDSLFLNNTIDNLDSGADNIIGVVIRCDKNLGFAGGNNIGLKWAVENTEADCFLVLNNDTVIEPNAMQNGVFFLRRNPNYGIAGCVVRYFHNPSHVQAYGGAKFFPMFGRASHLCAHMQFDQLPPVDEVQENISYPLGAAMFVSRTFLEKVGMMYEKYFLYFEEIDWACRGKEKGFLVGVISDSVIFHKEGGTIGSSHIKSERSYLSEQFLNRARLMFTRRWFPLCIPSVLLYNVFLATRALARGDVARARIIYSSTWQGLTCDL